MADVETQDSQKTLVAFVVGLLIGGMLVWAFSGPNDQAPKEEPKTEVETSMNTDETKETTKDTTPKLTVGDGKITVNDQAASSMIEYNAESFPVAEGWIGIRQYTNDELGPILGVNRFSESQGLIPEKIELVYPTVAGKKYAVVVFKENGDNDWEGGDEPIDEIFSTFTAQ